MLTCTINGQSQTVEPGTTIEGLIAQLGMGDSVCAVEVDKKLVPKRERASVVLTDGQQIEIVSLIGGG